MPKFSKWVELTAPWITLFFGLFILDWLHGFRDRLAHTLIPLFLIGLWAIVLLLFWDGRKRLWWTFGQASVSALIIVRFVLHLID
jgi:hypothetical protein